MKKNLLAITLAIVMLLSSMFVFASCGSETEPETTTNPQSTNVDEPTNPEVVDMTEGVYNCKMGSYELLIKFYPDNVFYMQNEMAGYRGKYEIKDEEIMFTKSQADGTDYNSVEHPNDAAWLTGNKVIYFYQEDGTTPIDVVINSSEKEAHDATTIVAGVCYAYGTKSNVLAYNVENDTIQSFKGNYGSRTLSHTKLRNFTINDEKSIEQAKYMVATLPEGAAAGKLESDYFLTLSQKGYETNIPTLEALDITNGKFKQDGNVYSLTDTISGAKATLTITEKGATVTVGEQTVELVSWADVTPYAVEVVGSAFGGKIQAKVRFNEDGSLVIFGSTKNFTGKYKVNKDGTVTISDVEEGCPVTIKSANVKTENDVTTLTAELSIATGNAAMPTAEATATGTVTGKLVGLGASVALEVESNEAVYANNKLKLEMKDNCTFDVSIGGQVKASGFWTLNVETRSISFSKVSLGTMSYDWNSGAPTITWTGKLSDTQVTDSVYTFSFAAQELGKLMGAKVEEKYSVSTTVAKLGGQSITLTFLADGTATMGNERMTIDTADWAMVMNGMVPSLTFANSNGTFTGAFGADGYNVSWSGDITTSQGSVSVEAVFSFPTSDLANLR